MSTDALEILLRRFRHQLAMTRVIRVALVVMFLAAIYWASRLGEPKERYAILIILAAGLLGWIFFLVHTLRVTREVQAGSVLLTTGQLDDAEVWLRRVVERFSLSVQAKILAGQQLASLFFRRSAYQDVVAMCQELLRHRIRRVRNVWVNTRLMLADSLLMLDRVSEAYAAMRPVYDVSLSLADRMKLLPIQLRYELAADHAALAVQALAEKVQIAELLDAPRAALVHALLAEACRREAMPAQRDFLAERARLYFDLDQLVQRYAVIAPIADEGDRYNGL